MTKLSRLAPRLDRCLALLFVGLLALSGCSTAPPEGMAAVTPFDLSRYDGKWYELARLDHSFERGLSDVSATYRVQADGSVEVINRGYDAARGDWRQAAGRAVFTGDRDRASLKVSFFGPFYGGYHVVALDQEDYRWAWWSGRVVTTCGFWPETGNSRPTSATACSLKPGRSGWRSTSSSGSSTRATAHSCCTPRVVLAGSACNPVRGSDPAFSALLAEVEADGEVVITRRGKPVARLVAEPQATPFDWSDLREWVAAAPQASGLTVA